MNQPKNGKHMDVSKAAYTKFGVGVVRGNPRRCLYCGKPIKRGEAWQADTSAEDPDGYGRYTVILHAPSCPDQRAYKAFQKRLTQAASG